MIVVMKKMDGILSLRQLHDSAEDYQLLEKWYQEEEIYSHFEQRKLSYKEVKDKYYPRTLKDTKIPVYMILYNDMPIGIIQYQSLSKENQKLYGIQSRNAYEIDIFIGELSMQGKGLGQQAVNILSSFLFQEKGALLLVMCPLKNNKPAIECYKKCGFKIKNVFQAEDTIGNLQEYLLMIKK